MATRAEREFRERRMIAALQRDPDLTNTSLREIFGVTSTTISRIRLVAGVPAPVNTVTMSELKRVCKTPDRYGRDSRHWR